MAVVIYGVLGISMFMMVRHDIQTQTVPLYALLAFILATLFHQFQEPVREGLEASGIIFAIFWGCEGLFLVLRRSPAMGWADLILAPCCGLWFYVHEIPVFLVGTGITALLTGIFWQYWRKMKTFPLVPAILSGWGLVLLIRCFFMVNRVWV